MHSGLTNAEFNEKMRKRFTAFSILIIRFLETVPFNSATKVLTFQLGKSATSMGANHRAYCRGRSNNERFAKICIVVEESDETQYWLELFNASSYGDKSLLKELIEECDELVKIATSIKSNTFPD